MQLICGMHRSGTSLVARLLLLAGADFGDPGGFHPADRWNKDGYFEQSDVLRVNIALVNGPWWRFSYLWLPSERVILRRARRRAPVIGVLARKYRDRMVKENRFCLTLDAWRRHGAEISEVLIVVRNPRDVAASLKRRNRIPIALAYRLWCQHYERLLAATRAIRRRFLSYDRLIQAPAAKAELAEALSFFGMPTAGAERLLGEVVHFSDRGPPPPPAYPPRVAALYQRLSLAAAAPACSSP